MATACIPQIAFGFERKGQPIVAAFEQPQASSDGGAVLRKSLDSTMTVLASTCAIDLHDRRGRHREGVLALSRQPGVHHRSSPRPAAATCSRTA